MKTSTNLLGWLLLCSFFLINFTAKAQYPYPTATSPTNEGTAVLNCGLLQDPDQKTKPIWFKVSGNMAGGQPHNKMHPFVTPGSYVDVNFNVNKNIANRYTLVTYTVAPDGTRTIYDYQSNLYNQSKPVQGNSNQQLVLVPTCKFEIYWVKGCVIPTFNSAQYPGVTPAGGPAGNPYGTNILDYAYGGTGECDDCPAVVGATECIFPRVLEVIDDSVAQEKEIIMSVINTIGTQNGNCGDFDFLGDIIFTNINPVHLGNNQPYQFRYNYQLGPAIPGYPLPNPPANPGSAFVFDQRNNHNILAYDQYQSEIVRFTVSYAEFDRLSNLAPTDPQPQICVELSSKHPEPHQTIPPIYCAEIDFDDCGGQDCPTVVDTDCYEEDCCFGVTLFGAQVGAGPGQYSPFFEVTNLCGEEVTSITFSTPEMATDPAAAERVYNINAAANLLTFADPVPPFASAGDFDQFIYFLSAAAVEAPGGNLVTVTVNTTTGSHTFNFDLFNDDPSCGIIPLPVELLNFDGKLSGEDIALTWRTATEKDNDRFEIERSTDGRKFEKIGSVKGSGTSTNMLEYGFLDKDPGNGVNYYRLNQVDLDGTAAHSPIIKVNTNDRGKGPVVQLIPNPCNGESCTVHLKGFNSASKLTVELRDLTGRLIFSKQLSGDQTSFELPRVTSGEGVYILSARDGSHTTFQKVVIQ